VRNFKFKMDINTIEKYNDLLSEIQHCTYQRKRNEDIERAYKLIRSCGFNSFEDFSIAKNANQSKLLGLETTYNVIQACSKQFAICLLIDEMKNVWISRRNNKEKDFYDHYQVTGGLREVTSRGLETERECAIREIYEETGLVVQENDLREICDDSYFSDYENSLYHCKIFFACIYDQVPQQMEPDKNDDWVKVDKDKFFSYKLTRSLIIRSEDIKRKISSFRVNKNKSKKRDRNEKEESEDDKENVKRLCLESDNLGELEEGEIKEELQIPEIKRDEFEDQVDYN
jgi:8-oxo-dGTP pyrophosphatase MutT (NUDIX family)